MNINVNALKGKSLDYAVALAEGIKVFCMGDDWPGNSYINELLLNERVCILGLSKALTIEIGDCWAGNWSPSTDWSQGGPLIEKHQVELQWTGIDGKAIAWNAIHQDTPYPVCAVSYLEAAMRAIVLAELGE